MSFRWLLILYLPLLWPEPNEGSNAENETAVDGELDVPRSNAFGHDFR